MLQMDLPHLNVLTKIDNLRNYPDLPFNLDFYTEVQDLNYLLPYLNKEQSSGRPGPKGAVKDKEEGDNKPEKDDNMDVDDEEPTSKFSELNKAIVNLVEDFALVGFETLAVEDKKSMMTLLRAIDRAGGYAFGGIEGANDSVWQVAMRQDAVTMDARDVQERWLDRREEMDEEERKAWEMEAKGGVGEESTVGAGPEIVERAPQRPEEPKMEGGALRDETGKREGNVKGGAAADSDDEDMEDLRKFMAQKDKDTAVKIVKKQE